MKKLIGLVAILLTFTACQDSQINRSGKGPLQPSIVDIKGHTLLCVRYTTAGRGGLWCEEIGK